MASRNVLGWRKKMVQEERGLEITGKLETRKQMIETSEKNILFIQRMTSSVVQNAV